MAHFSKPLKVVFALVLVFAGYEAYHYKNNFAYFGLQTPCVSPITYRVGTFDSRFNISQDQFKQAIADAAQIWDKAAGHNLFQYDNNGLMPVNLIYDYRQQATDQLKKLNLSTDSTQKTYNQLKATYLQYKSSYLSQDQAYTAAQQQYNAAKQSYEAEVQYWNSRGDVPPSEAEKLNAEREQLNSQAESLNQKAAALNQLIANINALATTLNRIGTELNSNANTYNSIGQNMGEFEEGLYTGNNFSKNIDIYQFDDYNMLVRVLAHELGHSLGMEHVNDPNAIMYKQNQSKNSVPTAADIAELNRVCKFK